MDGNELAGRASKQQRDRANSVITHSLMYSSEIPPFFMLSCNLRRANCRLMMMGSRQRMMMMMMMMDTHVPTTDNLCG